MLEFKTVSFIILDSKGKGHRVAMNKLEAESADFSVDGDPALLLRRWGWISDLIETELRKQVRDQESEAE